MDREQLLDLLIATVATGGVTALLGALRSRLSERQFRLVGGGLAAVLILAASLLWKSGMLEWLVGPSPVFLTGALVVLVVATVQAVAAPGASLEEPRLSKNARRVISALPVSRSWNEGVIAWALGVTRNHFGLPIERATTEVSHMPSSVPRHTQFDYQTTLVLRQPVPGRVRLAIEVVPEIATSDGSGRFGPLSAATHQLAAYSTITIFPLVEDAEFARTVMNEARVCVEIWGEGREVRAVTPERDERLTIEEGSGPPFARLARRWRFDFSTSGERWVRLKIGKLLHTNMVPVIYFQPEFVVLDEWSFRAEAQEGIKFLAPAILDSQIPIEGELAVSPEFDTC